LREVQPREGCLERLRRLGSVRGSSP
jgi:hypothetical protein